MSEFDLVEEWMVQLRDTLDLTDLEDIDIPTLLNVVREVAHSVIHPAGPVSMFAAGYAASKAGGSREAVDAILAQVKDLATEFAADKAEDA